VQRDFNFNVFRQLLATCFTKKIQIWLRFVLPTISQTSSLEVKFNF